jgi:hypothetical protein
VVSDKKQNTPAANVRSDGDIHGSVPVEPPLISSDTRRPELEPGRVVAVVKETTFADGCTKSVSTLSAEGEAVGEDRAGSISFVGSVWTRRTPGCSDGAGALCSGVLGAVAVVDDIVRKINRPCLQRVEGKHVGDGTHESGSAGVAVAGRC